MARVERAARIVKLYAHGKAIDSDETLSEILCDLMAWSRREGINIPERLRYAVFRRQSEYLEAQLDEVTDE